MSKKSTKLRLVLNQKHAKILKCKLALEDKLPSGKKTEKALGRNPLSQNN